MVYAYINTDECILNDDSNEVYFSSVLPLFFYHLTHDLVSLSRQGKVKDPFLLAVKLCSQMLDIEFIYL